MSIAMELAGGSWIFLGACIWMLIGVIVALYTTKGSGISETPYGKGKIYGGAPGAQIPASRYGRDRAERLHDWQRGTRSPRRPRDPPVAPRPNLTLCRDQPALC